VLVVNGSTDVLIAAANSFIPGAMLANAQLIVEQDQGARPARLALRQPPASASLTSRVSATREFTCSFVNTPRR
jgi:hypothetical protein